MGAEQRGFRQRPAYALSGSWAAKPAATAVADGTVYMATDLAYSLWVARAGYWRPQGGSFLLPLPNVNGITFNQTTFGPISGTRYTCPLAEWLSVPGAYMRTHASATRASPSTAQACLLGVSVRTRSTAAGGGVLSQTDTNPVLYLNAFVKPVTHSPLALRDFPAVRGYETGSHSYNASFTGSEIDTAVELRGNTGGGSEVVTVEAFSVELICP